MNQEQRAGEASRTAERRVVGSTAGAGAPPLPRLQSRRLTFHLYHSGSSRRGLLESARGSPPRAGCSRGPSLCFSPARSARGVLRLRSAPR